MTPSIRSPWTLADLFSAAGLFLDRPFSSDWISQVTDDSRAVRPGALFVAVRGSRSDGHRFLAEAVERGARGVVVEEEFAAPAPVLSIRVKSTRAVLGPLLHAFYGSPSLHLSVVGVTGTKGKTTVTWLIQHLLESCGIRCGLVGTVCTRWNQKVLAADNTTPGSAVIQRTLAEMAADGVQACAMEVSSHALDQQRTDGIRWACGVFTNLDSEHLDYHGTMANYRNAKKRLFEGLPIEAAAVLHDGDPAWKEMAEAVKSRVITYGTGPEADFQACGIRRRADGTRFELVAPGLRYPVESSLIGLHNVENLLAAFAAVHCLNIPLEWAAQAAADFPGVPGRLERIDCGQPFPVFVDYAHTDAALKRVLSQLREITHRKILTVFGCGGDRDRAKRPRMGRVAAELSDKVIVTSDNPRSEDPAEIVAQITAGMKDFPTPVEVILDRAEAIRSALESANEQWLVLIAGKGHENRQIFADGSVPFDDRSVVREILGEIRIASAGV